jgi:hypothetical protein
LWLLTGTLIAYNTWLEENSERTASSGHAYPAPIFVGFLMGFRKDHPVYDAHKNLLMVAGVNLHQG